MALRAISGFEEQLAEWAREEAMAGTRFLRAMHWRHTPYPMLRGPRIATWLARRFGVYAEIEWVRDPDWEPPTYQWNEDALVPSTPGAETSEAVSPTEGTGR